MNETVGIIIGKFQTPVFTDAWKRMVQSVVENHQFTAIFLSTSPIPGNREQPLSYVMRRLMIEDAIRVTVLPLYDMARQTKWVQRVEAMVRENYPLMSARIYGPPDVVEMYQKHGGKHPVTPLQGPDVMSEMEAAREKVVNTADFRKGVIYAASHRYKHVVSTVDGAVMKNDMVLLGRKPNEEEFRIIGGFTETISNSDEEDLSREVLEEAGLSVNPDDWYYLGRMKVNDWRYQGNGDAIRTGFFVTFDFQGDPVAGDDLAEVRWVKATLTPAEVPLVTEHYPLWHRLQFARQSIYEQHMADKRLQEARRAVAAAAARDPEQSPTGTDLEDVPF